MRVLVCIIFAVILGFGAEYKIASYNVENLFDCVVNGSEYDDFKGKNWSCEDYSSKLNNISRVIKSLDADIIAVEEVENYEVLKQLAKKSDYEYFKFETLDKKSPIGLGIMSKFPIQKSDKIIIPGVKTRPILKAEILLEGEKVNFFVAHFPAYKNSLSKRKAAARTMIRAVNDIKNAIILGDLNSNFGDEFLLNDLEVSGFKNLWNDIGKNNQKSHKNGTAIDHIILSKDFFDNDGINYKSDSFGVMRSGFVAEFSDHYPIFAVLSDKKQKNYSNLTQDISQIEFKTVNQIYSPSTQKSKISGVVCFEDKNGFALCDKDGRGIYVFYKNSKPKIGEKLIILVHETKFYKDNLEISDFEILKRENFKENIENFGLKDLSKARSGDVAFNLNLDIKNGFTTINDRRYKVFSKSKKIKDGKIFVKSAMFWTYEEIREIIIE